MALNKYLDKKSEPTITTETNVLKLILRSRLEEKQEKRKNIVIAAAAISALAISGLIISF